MRFWSYVIFLIRDQWKIERWSEAMGAALVGNNFSPIPSKSSFHMKQKMNCRCPISTKANKALKPFWLSNKVSIAKVVAHFLKRASRGQQLLPPTRKRPIFVLARPTHASRAGAGPQELGHWFCSQILRLSSRIAFGSDCQMTGAGWQGLELGLELELCRLTNGL